MNGSFNICIHSCSPHIPKPNKESSSLFLTVSGFRGSLLTSTISFASHGPSANLHFNADLPIFLGQACNIKIFLSKRYKL